MPRIRPGLSADKLIPQRSHLAPRPTAMDDVLKRNQDLLPRKSIMVQIDRFLEKITYATKHLCRSEDPVAMAMSHRAVQSLPAQRLRQVDFKGRTIGGRMRWIVSRINRYLHTYLHT